METGGGIPPNAEGAGTRGDQSPAVRAGNGGVTVGYRMMLVLADIERATVAKLVEDTDACNRSSVRYHLTRMLAAGLVEEAGLIHQHGCVQRVMTYRLARRFRGTA